MAKENRGNNKSAQAKEQSAARKEAQAKRGSPKFTDGSNPHHGASKGQSGQPPKK